MAEHRGTASKLVSLATLSRALDALPAAFVVYDADDRIFVCNQAYTKEYTPFEHVVQPGISHTELQWLKVRKGLDANAIGREEAFVAEELDRHKNGPEVEEWTDDHGRHIRLLRARLPGGETVGMRFDITDLREAQLMLEEQKAELEAAQSELLRLAMTDDLTDLTNRRAAEKALDGLLTDCRDSGQTLSVLHADLDGFKQINDRFGHAAGDVVLRTFGERLKAEAPKGAIAARIGGDEFMIVVARRTEAEMIALAERIIAATQDPIMFEDKPCKVGVSIGIASLGPHIESMPDLLKSADLALYRSKENGRNQYSVFDRALRDVAEHRSRLSQDLLDALDRDEFEVFLQPIVRSSDQRVVSAEALVRWQHPELGLLVPDQFLSIAEDMKLIGDIDALVLRKLLAMRERWTGGAAFPSTSINLSQMTLRDRSFSQQLSALDIMPDAVSFEIVETVFVNSTDDALQWNLDWLREQGFELAIDDFGTGYSSIAGVIFLQPQRLKVDRRFTQNLQKSETAREIVKLTVALARAFDASVTAEGVETQDQAEILKTLGCDRMQGFLFGRPMPEGPFFEFLSSQHRMVELPDERDSA